MIYIYNFGNEKDMFSVCFFWLVDDYRCSDACMCAGKALQRGSCSQRAHWEVAKEGTVADICASCLCSIFCSERALTSLSGLVFSV
jgi:hypothetical protein